MLVDPNSRLFDRVPDLFTSPFPGADAFADDAFDKLLQRATAGNATVGAALLSQAGAQAWNQAVQMVWKQKATIAGDVLGDLWSRVSWLDESTAAIRGILAEVAFPQTADPARIIAAVGSVALDLALNALTAVPVVGWVAGIAVGIGRALAPVFADLRESNRVPAERRRLLPWRRYNEHLDQEWVRAFIKADSGASDWTSAFSPPTDPVPWSSADGLDDQGQKIGQVLAPFAANAVAWNGGYGCIPGTFRVAG
ncbi:MAG TPA: hypothetical protein PKW35_17885, partial [Nannocystaceae bacterium]|nr:hypothetical protein [Nannocystaceae bacterium]